jgi:hypothetical protein
MGDSRVSRGPSRDGRQHRSPHAHSPDGRPSRNRRRASEHYSPQDRNGQSDGRSDDRGGGGGGGHGEGAYLRSPPTSTSTHLAAHGGAHSPSPSRDPRNAMLRPEPRWPAGGDASALSAAALMLRNAARAHDAEYGHHNDLHA